MSKTPQTLLFDLGGVLLDWNPAYLYERLIPDAADRDYFLTHICSMAWHGETDRGMPMADNVEKLCAQYPDQAEWIRAWNHNWPEMFRGYMPGMEALVRGLLGEGHVLYGLSNLPAEKYSWVCDEFPCLTEFQDIIVSGEEGVIKPEQRIYEITCERSGLSPSDFLFIDDLEKNIEAARAFGFEVHLFQGVEPLSASLKEAGFIR